MLFEEYNKYNKIDILKDILISIMVTILFFGYWMIMLLILSLILVNVWKIKIEAMCIIAGILTILSSIVYIWRLVVKRRKGIF